MYIISPQTAAKTSEEIDCTQGPFPMSIVVVGTLDADEFIDVYTVDIESATRDTKILYDEFGVAVTLANTSQPLTIPSPIMLKFDKPITDDPAGVILVKQRVGRTYGA